jgi:biotin transporter BioY
MNVFATDHPLSSESRQGKTEKALLLVLAVVLSPFVLGLLWLANEIANQETPDVSPDSFWLVLPAALLDGLIVALVVVVLRRLTRCFRGYFSRLRRAS